MQEVWGSNPRLGGLRVSPSLWRDNHPAIKGLPPPEHHAGKFHLDHKKTPPIQKHQMNNEYVYGIYIYIYIYIHTHVHTYTYIYTYRPKYLQSAECLDLCPGESLCGVWRRARALERKNGKGDKWKNEKGGNWKKLEKWKHEKVDPRRSTGPCLRCARRAATPRAYYYYY